MSEPLVCAIMLTKDRPAMAKRAVECFRSQTYPLARRSLYVYDSGVEPCLDALPELYPEFGIRYHKTAHSTGRTIGTLRNQANQWNNDIQPDIFIHFDDDDWSHPNRISEQVALLQASGKQCVGYRNMVFWKEPEPYSEVGGEAWLYNNNDHRYALGTSLCYHRSTWERRPFPNISAGEDKAWLREVESLGETSLWRFMGPSGSGHDDLQPRMIASIHSGNHVTYQLTPNNWKRVPEWDEHCREVMSL